MCGRFGLTATRGRLSKMFPGVQLPPELEARYNIAPTQPVLAVGAASADLVRWGITGRSPTGHFNLRAETILGISPNSELLTTGRVVVPASHFYEWTGKGSRRHPLAIGRRDGDPLAMAGVRATWTDASTGQRVAAVTIITTVPNALVAPFHHRMPVLLDDGQQQLWRRGEPLRRDRLRELLAPAPAAWLEARPVSRQVNNARNEGPALLEPPEPETEEQLELLA